jgi:hypothetical protein
MGVTVTAHRTLLALTAATLIIAGCGGSNASDAASSAPASGPPESSDQQAPPSRLIIDVTIADGSVTASNADLQAALVEPIVIRVDSDAADQLHIHSVPEYTFDVEPRSGQSFQFSVDVPGRVALELHELNRTIATIEVR